VAGVVAVAAEVMIWSALAALEMAAPVALAPAKMP
jgi:hypothetical protein